MTGVQTCALPICRGTPGRVDAIAGRRDPHILWLTDGGPAEGLADAVSPAVEQWRALPDDTSATAANLAVEDVRVRPDPTDPERGTLTVRLRNDAATAVGVQLQVSSSATAQTLSEFLQEANLRVLQDATAAPGRTTVTIADAPLPSPRVCVRVVAQTPGFRDQIGRAHV